MINSPLSLTTQLAQQLIACPSLTPSDAGCQKILAKRLSQIGFTCEPMRFDDVDNLWARYGTTGPLFIFAGHTDVVPTGPGSAWRFPPFQAVVHDGVLYGRGAVDMKGALAAMVLATERFITTHSAFSGSIGFLLTSDEEGPAINGTAKVVEALLTRGETIDYCVIGEPSSDARVGDQIRIGRRGSLYGKLTVHGKQGHVAHPHLALNPIHLSALALHELAHTEWDKGDDIYPPTTFQISNIHAGTGAANVVPGSLEMLCNFRFSTAVTVAALQERMENILKKHGINYSITWNTSAQPFFTRRGELVTITQQAIHQVTGLQTRLSTGGGTSDGRFITPTGAEVIELGVLHATAHHINENVTLADLDTLAEIYYLVLKGLLSH